MFAMVSQKGANRDRLTELWEKAQQAGMTRRKFLTLLMAGGAAAVLTACSQSVLTTSIKPSTTNTAPAPKSTATTSTTTPTSTAATKPAASAAATAKAPRGRRPGSSKNELLYWDKANAYNGYTLWASGGRTYLLDMEGKVVNAWDGGTNPQLLPNGNLFGGAGNDPNKGPGWVELDWNSNVVWSYYESRDKALYNPHHDWRKIYNPKLKQDTLIYIANRTITQDEAIAIGCDPKKGPYTNGQMDTLTEVDMQGNIIWEWRFVDHVIQDIDPSKPNYVGAGKKISDYPGRINVNMPGRPVRQDWLHCNSMDYNQQLDQLVTNSVQGEFYVIDHGNTFVPGDPKKSMELAAGPAGDFLYRFGDPARYGQGNPPSILEDWTTSTTGHKQIGGSHDIQWIREGLPGAGNFLIHVNGQYLFEATPQSYVYEINGFLDKQKVNTGKYVNPPDAGYYSWSDANSKDTHKRPKQMSNQIVYIYYSLDNTAFFNHIGGGAQRLPNGNLINCNDVTGHIFEVTKDGMVVWDYISPVYKSWGILEYRPDCYPNDNAVFRAYRYGTDYPGLKGKDLTPKGTVISLYKK